MLKLWLLFILLLVAIPLALYVVNPVYTIAYLYAWLMLAMYGHGKTLSDLKALKAFTLRLMQEEQANV